MHAFRLVLRAAALSSGIAVASLALAAGTDLSSADKIKVVDTDGDGVLTAAEHAAASRAMFDRMDGDRDGALTKGEFDAGHAMLKK